MITTTRHVPRLPEHTWKIAKAFAYSSLISPFKHKSRIRSPYLFAIALAGCVRGHRLTLGVLQTSAAKTDPRKTKTRQFEDMLPTRLERCRIVARDKSLLMARTSLLISL